MIYFKCSQCDEKMEAPSSIAGEEIACPKCGQSRKIPLPRPATDKQKAYAKKLGLQFSNDISLDDISDMIDSFNEVYYFILDLWESSTGSNTIDCGIPLPDIHNFVRGMLKEKDVFPVIMRWRQYQYDVASEKSSEAQTKYEEQGGPEPLDFKEYLPPVTKFPAYKEFSKGLHRLWKSYLPKG